MEKHTFPEQRIDRPPAMLQQLVDTLSCEFASDDVIRSDTDFVSMTCKSSVSSVGWCDISIVRPGLTVTAAEVRHEEAIERRHGGGDLLKLHFCISGGSHIDGEYGSASDVKTSSLVCFTQPLDSEKRESVSAHVDERSVTLSCTRDFLSDVADNCSLALPAQLLDFAGGKPSSFLCEQMPLPQAIRQLAEDIMTVRASPFARFIREARSLELLSLSLIHLSASCGIRPLRDRDQDRVRQVCEIIQHETEYTHSIRELSRLVGWNETQLMACFKAVTGATINGYRHRHRMDHAMRRLRDGGVSVTELAFDLGYEHPGNFATAFKKTFGFSPKAARTLRPS